MKRLSTFLTVAMISGICLAQVAGRPASETYVASKINAHNSTNNAHADIRASVFAATTNLNALVIVATNATEAAHAATVQANAAILKNTQQDASISSLYTSNANAFAIANLANTRAQAANVTNAQNGAAIASVSNLTVTAQNTANAAVGGVTAVSNLVIGVKALNENAITNETDSLALSIMATNRTTIVYNPTNSNEWTDGANRVWRIEQRAVTNETQLTMYESGFNQTVTITKVPGFNQWSGMDAYGEIFAFGDMLETGEYYADAWSDQYEYADWRICTPSGLEGWPKTYGNELENTGGWVDLIVTQQTVTTRVDTVALISDLTAIHSAPTNAIAGWLLFDPGSNVWLTVTVSNLSFKVWEVQ